MSLVYKERSSKYYLFTEDEMYLLSDYYNALPLFAISSLVSFGIFLSVLGWDNLIQLFFSVFFLIATALGMFGAVHTWLCYKRLIDTVIAETEAGKS